MAFDFIKRGSYQTAVDLFVWNNHGKNLDNELGAFKKAELAVLVFNKLKKENNVCEARFIELYIEELKQLKYL